MISSQDTKPKTLCCYICGREFGTMSLSIHMKSCIIKYQNQQAKKQSSNRKQRPAAPQQLEEILAGNLDMQLIEKYNTKAIQLHKYKVLSKCQFCDRTFNQQSLKAHQNGCNKKGQQKVGGGESGGSVLPADFKKPRTLTCCICGRDFGLKSLKIHYPQCGEKFTKDESKKPKNQRKPTPEFSETQIEIINNKEDWTTEQIQEFNKKSNNDYRDKAMVQCQNCGRKFIQESYQKHKKNCVMINGQKQNTDTDNSKSKPKNMKKLEAELKKPRTLQCCVCGREFGMTSLKIHYPQCLEKFNNEEKKKPKAQRKVAPEFTENQLEMINNKEDWNTEDIEEFNKKANNDYRDKAMIQCPNCGRKFIEESFKKHSKNCELISGKNPASISLAKQKQRSSMSIDGNRPTSSELKKPRTLTCCVCGRDFGLTSLKIHYPQCLEKFIKDEKKKSKSERKIPPQFTIEQLEMINNHTEWSWEEIQTFNKKANTDYRDKAMVQCQNCGRKFIEESYQKHKKNCVMINGKKQSNNSGTNQNSDRQNTSSQLKKPRVFMCHICGREFGVSSLAIHRPQCEDKFLNAEKKKQKQERRPLPCFPEDKSEIYDLKTASEWDSEKIEQFNKISNEVYRQESLCPCPICGRKFFQESLPKHLKFCQKNKEKQESLQKRPVSGSKSKEQNKKASNNGVKMLSKQQIEKIDQVKEEAISSPENQSPVKPQQNQSFLKNELYKKIGSPFNDKKGPPNVGIEEADQQLEETFKIKLEPSAEQKDSSNTERKAEDLSDSQEQQSSGIKTQSTPSRGKSARGFAAPRKKQESHQANMKQCKICNRKFPDDKITKHQKLCADNKDRQNRSLKKIESQRVIDENPNQQPQIQQTSELKEPQQILTADQKVQKNKGFAAPREKQQQIHNKMSECRGCKRKFAQDRIAKHESICKQAQDQAKPPIVTGSYKNIDEVVEQKISIKRAPCPKCNRKFADDRLQKHIEICKANPTTAVSNSKSSQKNSSITPPPAKQLGTEAFQNNLNLQGCEKCGRKFNVQRLNKHMEVCKGDLSSAGKNLPEKKGKDAKQTKQPPKKSYDLENIQIKSPLEGDLRVECPKCSRKFASDRFEKHVQICKAVSPQQAPSRVNKIHEKMDTPPKKQQQAIKTIGEDQYTQNQLSQCNKCHRKFIPDRLQKHMQACKQISKAPPKHQQNKIKVDLNRSKNITELKKKIDDQQIRKTKNEFFTMVKDLKQKKVKEEQIQKEIEEQLHEIQATAKITKKDQIPHNSSEKKKQPPHKLVHLPKI